MLRKVTLELTVLDYDRIGGSDPIGKVRLGYSRKKLEKKHCMLIAGTQYP